MKYLFINSVAGFGSTGKIAAAQCRELMAQGHECLLAYGRDCVNCDGIPTLRIGTKLDYNLHGTMNRVLDNHGFGSKAATRRFLQQVRAFDPDVIWLHNIHGYYIHIGLLFDYLRTCGKQIFWMLHDCWTFTGHCSHFSFVGCDKWKTGCHHCPQKDQYPASLVLDNSKSNYEKKRALFTGIPNMTLITPSYWLADLVKQSFLQEYPVEVVYHTVNTEVFRPTESDFRQKHGLQNKKIALGVSSIWNDRKGLSDFAQLASMLDSSWQIVLVGIKPEQKHELPDNVLAIPRTNSQKELAEIYSAADIFVNPSREETFGLTTVEALSCGTKAIVYKGTACEEIVEKFGGVAVSVGVRHLYDALIKL